MRKTDAEVRLMKEVALMSDAGMIAFLKAAEPGVSEHDLAAEANYALFKAGAEDTAFPMAGCGGPRSGFKHSIPTNRKLRAGEIAFTDLGAPPEGLLQRHGPRQGGRRGADGRAAAVPGRPDRRSSTRRLR